MKNSSMLLEFDNKSRKDPFSGSIKPHCVDGYRFCSAISEIVRDAAYVTIKEVIFEFSIGT